MVKQRNGGRASTAYVALLRGVNVGGNRKVPMAVVREVLTGLGLIGVRTYLQSGNAVFAAAGTSSTELVARIQVALTERFGFEVPTVVLTQAELAQVVAANPYPEVAAEPTKLVVSFLSGPVPREDAAAFDLSDFPEHGQIGDRVLYLHYPDGQGTSKLLPAVLERRLGGVWGTARNWRTVLALAALAGEVSSPGTEHQVGSVGD